MTTKKNSMAVWCLSKDITLEASLETHLNYWRVAGLRRNKCKRHKEDFLEVGLLVKRPSAISCLNIFIPFLIDRNKIEDLGRRFNDIELAQGIFNEKLTSRNHGDGQSWLDLQRSNGEIFCRVHIFSQNESLIDRNELAISQEHGGTILTISNLAIERSSRGLDDALPVYFRLRIFGGGKKGGQFVRVMTPLDRRFQSGFEEVEYLDVRLNESRTLPIGIERKMTDDATAGAVPLTTVAFLTAVPVLAELSVSHTAFHKNRLLEDAPWNTYAPQPLPPGMMVYHWKKYDPKIPVNEFTAFVKLQTRRTSKRIIACYLGIAFLFGVAGNIAAPWLQKLLPFVDPASWFSTDASNKNLSITEKQQGPSIYPPSFLVIPPPIAPKP